MQMTLPFFKESLLPPKCLPTTYLRFPRYHPLRHLLRLLASCSYVVKSDRTIRRKGSLYSSERDLFVIRRPLNPVTVVKSIVDGHLNRSHRT